jgi:cell division protein FtsL
MKRPALIATALKATKPMLRNYVLAIEQKNLNCEKQIAHLQAKVLTQQHKIAALNAEVKNLTRKTGLKLNITFAGDKPKSMPGTPS